MTEIHAFLREYSDIGAIFGFLWLATLIGASAIYRRSKGKPIRPEPPPNSIFVEKWTSGRSLRSFLTRLGGANNCLLVAVTHDSLIIRPHFPFTLGFLPEFYGLDWSIPRSKIKRVSTKRGIIKDSVLIEVSLPRGESGAVELRLRDPESFKAALEARA
jgi:hypothetical protein